MYINCQVNLSQIEIEPVASINNESQQLMLETGDKEARRIHVTKRGSSPAPARAPRARTRQVRGRPHPRPPGRVTGSRVADEPALTEHVVFLTGGHRCRVSDGRGGSAARGVVEVMAERVQPAPPLIMVACAALW